MSAHSRQSVAVAAAAITQSTGVTAVRAVEAFRPVGARRVLAPAARLFQMEATRAGRVVVPFAVAVAVAVLAQMAWPVQVSRETGETVILQASPEALSRSPVAVVAVRTTAEREVLAELAVAETGVLMAPTRQHRERPTPVAVAVAETALAN